MNLEHTLTSNSRFVSSCALTLANENKFLSISSESQQAILNYLNGVDSVSINSIQFMAGSSGIDVNYSSALKSAGSAITTVAGVNFATHCIEKILWFKYLCNIFNQSPSRQGMDTFLSALALSIILGIILLIFGPSLFSAVSNALKIHQSSQVIFKCRQENKNLQLLAELNQRNLSSHQQVAINIAMEANRQMATTYKQYRATRIAFLVVAIISCLALFALASGLILGFFFALPGSAAIIAAIIGCGASGGALLILGVIGFILSSVYEFRQQNRTIHNFERSILCAMVSDLISQKPQEYQRSFTTQQIAHACLSTPVS
ncbi:inclusion membrane protein GarD [Chlamydia avium]|uniref:Inner membrane protein n=1 Tax=Chlamydia avium TaxID=1457141 RepID=A0ABP2X6H2_9CHLA|nr:hypothetical protein [Chlamydia avium]EPP36422.1 hypothetical protein CP10743SC13_0671 [Chlamydia psittaci 10_743_SC13]EPP38409.1 hypothetical protein CP10881SC42_0751 [Chlamydia avium]